MLADEPLKRVITPAQPREQTQTITAAVTTKGTNSDVHEKCRYDSKTEKKRTMVRFTFRSYINMNRHIGNTRNQIMTIYIYY